MDKKFNQTQRIGGNKLLSESPDAKSQNSKMATTVRDTKNITF